MTQTGTIILVILLVIIIGAIIGAEIFLYRMEHCKKNEKASSKGKEENYEKK